MFALLMTFYVHQGHISNHRARVIYRSIDYTWSAAECLGIQDHTTTMLSMWVCESDFNPDCLGTFGERGICQTKPREFRKWRRFWLAHGVDLGPFSETKTQVYFGVAEYYSKLKLAHGVEREAVRRYNGSGGKACCYADRVLAIRSLIFGY